MSWTFHQFEDAIAEIKGMGPVMEFDGLLMREVILQTGERFIIDAALVFSSQGDAEACEARLSQIGSDMQSQANDCRPD